MLPYNPLKSTDVPGDLFPHVTEFCRSLSPEVPIYLRVDAGPHDILNNCPSNVQRHIDSDGGKAVVGWQIWEWLGIIPYGLANAGGRPAGCDS